MDAVQVRRKSAPPEPFKLTDTELEPLLQLKNEDRLKALLAALKRAQKSASAGPYFDTDKALRALSTGRMQLRGTPDQIKAQLMINRGAYILLKRLFAHTPDRYAKNLDLEPGEPDQE